MKFIKKRSILFVLLCSFGVMFGQSKVKIKTEELHLYNLLQEFRDIIIKSIEGTKDKKELVNIWGDSVNSSISPLDLVSHEIQLLHEIVEIFNSPKFLTLKNQFKNLKIQYKFINLLNSYPSINSLKSRHLRVIKHIVKDFDEEIRCHCLSKKNLLNDSEVSLFNKITRFNKIFLHLISKKGFMNIDRLDELEDAFIHIPKEIVRDNPITTTSIVAALGYLLLDRYVFKKK